MAITVVIEPTPQRPGYFEARVDGCLLCRSRQPLVDTARKLLDLGHSTSTVLEMKYTGTDDTSLSAPIGIAAVLTVAEGDRGIPRFHRWKPFRPREGWPSFAPADVAAASALEPVWMRP